MGHNRKEFKDLLVNTAMEGVTESYRRQNQPVKLNKDFHILKGVSYKSGITATMMVDKKSKGTWRKDPDVVEDKPSGPKVPTTLAQQMMDEKATKKTSASASTTTAAVSIDAGTAKKKGGTKKDASIKKGFLGSATDKKQPAPASAPAAKEELKTISTKRRKRKTLVLQIPPIPWSQHMRWWRGASSTWVSSSSPTRTDLSRRTRAVPAPKS